MEVNEKKEKIPRLSSKWTRRLAESLDGLFYYTFIFNVHFHRSASSKQAAKFKSLYLF